MRISENSPGERIERFIAAALSVILVGVHFLVLLNRGPLWRDEISSLTLATQPTMCLFWAALAFDPFPGFFFLVLRGWHALAGDTDFALRILGFLIGVACIGACWWNAHLTRRKTPILLLLLLGFSPNFIVWGDSLRAYGLGIFLTLILFGLFWRLTQGVTAARVAWTTVVAVLSVQTLYTNSLLVFAFAVAAVAVTARRRQWRTALVILAIGAIAAVSLLPYLSLFRQMQAWASLGQVNFSLSNSLFKLYIALLGSAHALLWLWVAMLSLSLVLAVWWQRSVPALEQSVESRDLALYGLICAVLAFVGTMGFYRAVGWGTNVWYYLPMLAAMAAGVDLILAQSRFHWAALARGGIGLLGVALLSRVVFGFSEFRASNIDLIANILGERATPGDLVVVWPSAEGITFQRYVKPSVDWTSIPTAPHLPSIPGDDFMLPYRERNSLRPTLDRIRQTLQDGHRVWVASTWPLQPFPDGRPREIEPLTSSFRPPAGYYLRGWGYQLVEELQRDADSISRIEVACDQPINPYERSFLTAFSREKQPTPAP